MKFPRGVLSRSKDNSAGCPGYGSAASELFLIIWMRRLCLFTILVPAEIFISEVLTMTATTQEICEMVELLPESEQELAREFIRRMVLAWDPDFVKVTAGEMRGIEEGMRQIEDGEYVDLDKL